MLGACGVAGMCQRRLPEAPLNDVRPKYSRISFWIADNNPIKE